MPPDAVGEVAVVEAQTVRRGTGDGRAVRALDAQRRQPRLPDGQRRTRAGRLQRGGSAVDREAQARREPPAAPARVRGRLAATDLVVTVAVELRPRLERRDLGHVDDVVDRDPVGADPKPRRSVHGEVAERMRRCDRGREHDDRERAEDDERAASQPAGASGHCLTPSRRANARASSA